MSTKPLEHFYLTLFYHDDSQHEHRKKKLMTREMAVSPPKPQKSSSELFSSSKTKCDSSDEATFVIALCSNIHTYWLFQCCTWISIGTLTFMVANSNHKLSTGATILEMFCGLSCLALNKLIKLKFNIISAFKWHQRQLVVHYISICNRCHDENVSCITFTCQLS